MAAKRLACELVTDARLQEMIAAEFSAPSGIADKAWPHLAISILAKLSMQHHLVISSIGSELLLRNIPAVLRAHVAGPEPQRVGNLMIDHRLERPEARERLRQMERETALLLKRRFGTGSRRMQSFDLVMNAEALAIEQMLDVLETAVRAKGLLDGGLLTPAAEAQIQFQVRLKLARYGIVPPDKLQARRTEFGHPSEEVFANLLDFYRIAWNYEPRSFPLQWDKDGNVQEAFTPDFYLPEFDLYIELTTMKQAHVTKKNRKIRLLRAIYPHVNIQVFYQKDVQDLVIKYGLPEQLAQ
ncbi:MAG TPA: cytidylate kinase family protein [Bryobacteraceae bacterium]|nr:cytidylate kinase family protein [Bryobacteraceae bacterium]